MGTLKIREITDDDLRRKPPQAFSMFSALTSSLSSRRGSTTKPTYQSANWASSSYTSSRQDYVLGEARIDETIDSVIDQMDEISEALSSNSMLDTLVNEDELLEELNALEALESEDIQTSTLPQSQQKSEIFEDDWGDDDDGLFGQKAATQIRQSQQNQEKKSSSLFGDDDDDWGDDDGGLFGSSPKKAATQSYEQQLSLFDDDGDDEHYERVLVKPPQQKAATQSQQTQQSQAKTSSSLFGDDDDDDLFGSSQKKAATQPQQTQQSQAKTSTIAVEDKKEESDHKKEKEETQKILQKDVVSDTVRNLILKQKADGSFPIDIIADLQKISKKPLNDKLIFSILEKHSPNTPHTNDLLIVLISAVVITVFSIKYTDQQLFWELVTNKTLTFIKKQKSKVNLPSDLDLLSLVNDFVRNKF